MRALRAGQLVLLLGLFLAACVSTQAQDQPENPPQQPQPPDAGGAQPQGEETPPLRGPQNDRTPASGVEDYRLTGLNLGRSFLLGNVQFNEIYDTNSNSAATKSTAANDSISNLHGSLALQWLSPKTALSLDYVGGVQFYSKGTNSIGNVQEFNVTEKLYFRRWTVLFGDDFSFLPQSGSGLGGFGYGPAGNPGLPGLGGGITNYNPFFVPGQSIQSLSERISNALVGQIQYMFGPRSSVYLSTTYGQVHFFNTGFLNSRILGLRVGYDYELDPKQTLTVAYNANLLDYSGAIPGFTNHAITAGYRRALTGRMSMIVQAGPQISSFNNPLAGSGLRVSWVARGMLRYLMVRNNIELSYLHHTTDGSGLLIGADSDIVRSQFGRILSRNWTGLLRGTFSHNASLRQTTGTTVDRHFNSWQADVSVQRALGRRASIELRYSIFRQTANTSVCLVSIACGSVSLRHQVGLGLNWTSRPYSLE